MPPVTVHLPDPPHFGQALTPAPHPDVLAFLAGRRSTSAITLAEPAPSPEELDMLLRLATRVPDHGKLTPWRFIVLRGEGKAELAARLEALAQSRDDARAAAKLVKIKTPPLCVAVVSRLTPGMIPEWEQRMSAGAVCTTLLYATLALGYGANWITDWYAYDAEAGAILGLAGDERIAGFILMGTPNDPPLERERPTPQDLVTVWSPPA